MPCENSNDTSVLTQSLDSLRTRTSRHGHLLASRHRCHAGKGCAPGKIVADCQPRMGRGWDLLPKDVHSSPVLGYGCETLFSLQIGWCEHWQLELSRFFYVFRFLSATGQVTDSMWLNGHNPAGRSKEGRGTHFPGNLGTVTREPMLNQTTEYKENFNHKKTKLNGQMQSVGLVPPSPACW